MTNAIVYNKEDFWFVDFIDSNYELLPAVGIFKTKEEAEQAAEKWKSQNGLASVGQSSW
jgi:hypothetical protein